MAGRMQKEWIYVVIFEQTLLAVSGFLMIALTVKIYEKALDKT